MKGANGMRHPNKNDHQRYHAKYGITNWLNNIGVTSHDDQEKLINDFLAAKGFKERPPDEHNKNRNTDNVKAVFVSHRFKEFCKFVYNNTEEQ